MAFRPDGIMGRFLVSGEKRSGISLYDSQCRRRPLARRAFQKYCPIAEFRALLYSRIRRWSSPNRRSPATDDSYSKNCCLGLRQIPDS